MNDHVSRTIRYAWHSLLLHKLQTALSMLGIIFAVTAVVLMLAIAEGAKKETLRQISSLGTNTIVIRQNDLTTDQIQEARKYLSSGLSPQDVTALRFAPDIISVEPLRAIPAKMNKADESEPPLILGATPGFATLKGMEIREGRFLCDLDLERQARVCVIGADTARKLGHIKIGQAVFLEDAPFIVVGILQDRGVSQKTQAALAARDYDRVVFIPSTSWPATSTYGYYAEINVQLASSAELSQYARVMERILLSARNGFKDFQVIVPEELLRQAQAAQRTFNTILGCIAGISLLVGGIGIMNTMIAAVTERTREIGIRRAIGASRNHIIREFLAEAILLTCCGGVFGLVLGSVGAGVVAFWAQWPVAITGWSVMLALLMSLGVGIFFGLYPAKKAAELDPIKALRYE